MVLDGSMDSTNQQSNIDSPEPWEYNMRREKQLIIPGIYLGPYSAAAKCKLDQLFADGITHIICVRDESESKYIKPNFPDKFEYLVLDIADNFSQNLIPFFPKVKEFINSCLARGGKVLVHGNTGISRSASLVISYIMDVARIPFVDALAIVQNKRYCIHPNVAFQRQLIEYEPIIEAQNVTSRKPIQKRSHELVEMGTESMGD